MTHLGTSGRRRANAVLLVAAVFAWLLPTALAAYKKGEPIEITGVVTDTSGTPIEGVRVLLQAARSGFSVRSFRVEDQHTTRVADTTDRQGGYSIRWPWNDYYNHFDLVVGIPVKRAGGREELHELARLDLTPKIRSGSPVVSAVTVADTDFLAELRRFVASVDTPDEQRIYDQMGKPDAVDHLHAADHVESSWFYFNQGKAYRFRDGDFVEVVDFAPVRPFE